MKKILILTTLSFGMLFPIIAQNIPSYVPTNGLVGWWPFNGNANDESGNGNDGTVNGATLTNDRKGVSNNAYFFDGVNDYIEFKTPNLPYLNSDRTISIWFLKRNNNSIWTHTALAYGSASKSNSIMIGVGNNNTIAVQGWADDIKLTQNSSNKWENITFSLTNGMGKVYYNGLLIATQDLQNWSTIESVFYLGSRCDLANSYFFGDIDDIAIYNRALTQKEITALYTSTSPCTNPTASITPQGNTIFCQGGYVNLNATQGANYGSH
jgi:trimeric autotransporter adhesin